MVLRLVVVRTFLETPPVPRIVPDHVFDGFGWAESHSLEWRRSDHFVVRTPESVEEITAQNPPGMIFVLRELCEFLPRELARLHVSGLGLTSEWALAPYGIDDATDELFHRDVAPERLLWLAAEDLAGLVWGLHDWSHFHNHGPFEARALTELQCDAAALVWLRLNRAAIGIDDATWDAARIALETVARSRFVEEGEPYSPHWLSATHLLELEHNLPARG
jgi:hypothetical protein